MAARNLLQGITLLAMQIAALTTTNPSVCLSVCHTLVLPKRRFSVR